MGTEIGSKGEVGVEGRGADLLLTPGQIRGLISNQREKFLSWPIPPAGELVAVCAGRDESVSKLDMVNGEREKERGHRRRTMVEAPEPSIGGAICAFNHCRRLR
jgi:hypothetical protein